MKYSDTEYWKPVADPQWSDLYEISSFGHVRKKNGVLLKASPSGKNGRLAVKFRTEGGACHRSFMLSYLVAAAYLGNLEGRKVQYKDGNFRNCRADNLYFTGKAPPFSNNNGGRRGGQQFEGSIAKLAESIFKEIIPETTRSLREKTREN